MTSRDEALRALEKVVELVAKATRGPWTFMKEKGDDCLLAFGTDSLEYDAPPPWYSCWTSINPDDGRALIAAVNFIREHGSAILATASEQVPVADGEEVEVVVCELGDYGPVDREMVTILFDDMKIAECYRAEDAEYVAAALREYSSPAHTSEARDAVLRGVRELALKAAAHWDSDEDMKVGKTLMALAGQLPNYDKRADAFDAAMRQEAGDV